MKFTVTSNDLLLQLQAVAKVINQKSVAAVPVLENILFELQGNILTLTAADQSNRLTCALEVNNLGEDGSFAVRSNIILDAIKELSDQPIEIDVDSEGGKATITYSNGHYSFLSTSADIYPQGIELDEARTIVMPAQSLLKGLERTLYAASDDDTRPIMTGVYLDFFPEKLVTVASDGRILVRYTDSNIKCGETASFCLPARIAQLLTRGILAKEAGEVTISFDGAQCQLLYAQRLAHGTSPRREVPQLQLRHPHQLGTQYHRRQGSALLRVEARLALLKPRQQPRDPRFR